jgi:hypothetical protein
MVLHDACVTVAAKTVPMIGFCAAAMTLASVAGTSLANSSRNFARSTYRNPAGIGLEAAPRGAGYFSPKALDSFTGLRRKGGDVHERLHVGAPGMLPR